MHRLFASLLLLAACAPTRRPTLPAPPPEPDEPEYLTTVSIDAEPVGMNGVVLDARGQNVARLVFSGAPVACGYGPRGEEPRLELTLVRGLGDSGWRIPRIHLGLGAEDADTVLALADAPKAELPSAIAEAMTVRTHFNVPVEVGGRTVRVEVGGAHPAVGCGSFEPVGAVEPLPDLIVTVGGEALPIVGAVYQRDGTSRQHHVSLSTSPLSCEDESTEAEVTVALTLDRIGRSVEAAVISGLRVGEAEAVSLSKGQLNSKLRGLGRAVHLELDGAADMGGHAFAFEGQADVAICR